MIQRYLPPAILGALALLLVCVNAQAADSCAKHLPYGSPQVTGEANLTFVCKPGYAAMHDDDRLIPRWVAYTLPGSHTLGCEKRKDNFRAEPDLPSDHRAVPADYAGTGYDKGHMAPAADFAHSKAQLSDSFSMVNMAPQKPGFNRNQWERLEETGRALAWERGELAIYVGTIVEKKKTIGKHHVAVPSAFFKILIDTLSGETLAFIAEHKDTPKGPLAPWLAAVSDVEARAGIKLPLPQGAARDEVAALWPADLAGWNKKHKATCGK